MPFREKRVEGKRSGTKLACLKVYKKQNFWVNIFRVSHYSQNIELYALHQNKHNTSLVWRPTNKLGNANLLSDTIWLWIPSDFLSLSFHFFFFYQQRWNKINDLTESPGQDWEVAELVHTHTLFQKGVWTALLFQLPLEDKEHAAFTFYIMCWELSHLKPYNLLINLHAYFSSMHS